MQPRVRIEHFSAEMQAGHDPHRPSGTPVWRHHVLRDGKETRQTSPTGSVSAAVGLALPKDVEEYGYLSEHHAYGETQDKTGEYAEDLAATMLATTLGIEFDANAAWQEREKTYKASGKIIRTKHVCQSAQGDKNGLWTTVIAAAVFL